MVAKSFEVGDLVWAKMKGYPYWPGKIIDPSTVVAPKPKKYHHYVLFYGYNNHAWIPDELILLHNERLVAKFTTQKKKPAMYQEAIDRIISESKNSEISKPVKPPKAYTNFEKHIPEESQSKYQKHESSFEKLVSKDSPSKSSIISKGLKKKDSSKKISSFKKIVKKRRSLDQDGDDEVARFSKSIKLERAGEDYKAYEALFANIPPNIGYGEDDNTPSSQGLLSRNNCVERPPTPSIDLTSENNNLKSKNIKPTAKKIGFIGLGKLGQGIVKNLLQSGHSVTIWNRTTTKCDPFKDIGAEVALTPADVVEASDITFSCLSDTDVAKNLFFCNCGVLKGLENSNGFDKGYVEMTSMDPKTSHAFAQEIKLKGGRYLEAQIIGSRVKAIEGTLFILGAGDSTLYDDCESCLHAIANGSKFLGSVVGTASKYNIIHNMLLGTIYGTLAESIALIKRTGSDPNDFLAVLQYSGLHSTEICEKGRLMIDRDYTSNTPLKHVQNDLRLALLLGSGCEQPLPITAAVNEVYKRLKLRYADHDVSAVFEGTNG